MSDWTARIDALLAEPVPTMSVYGSFIDCVNAREDWYKRRFALAAERLREPHLMSCLVGAFDYKTKGLMSCTCGKDSDLLRILEGR